MIDVITLKTKGHSSYDVFYWKELSGGGTSFGLEYPSVISDLYPNRVFDTCLEWCAGPGFIGYSILDYGLCKNLVLLDLYHPAIVMANKTAKHNNIESKVKTYVSDNINIVPNSIKLDLVVANPPHYNRKLPVYNRVGGDLNWDTHRDFYKNIGKYLTDDGIILMQESKHGSTENDFSDMINESNLKITNVFDSPNFGKRPNLIYYIQVEKQ